MCYAQMITMVVVVVRVDFFKAAHLTVRWEALEADR
jgi:hypothetical protein